MDISLDIHIWHNAFVWNGFVNLQGRYIVFLGLVWALHSYIPAFFDLLRGLLALIRSLVELLVEQTAPVSELDVPRPSELA